MRHPNDLFCSIRSFVFSLIRFYDEKYVVSSIFTYVGCFSVFEMSKMIDGA